MKKYLPYIVVVVLVIIIIIVVMVGNKKKAQQVADAAAVQQSQYTPQQLADMTAFLEDYLAGMFRYITDTPEASDWKTMIVSKADANGVTYERQLNADVVWTMRDAGNNWDGKTPDGVSIAGELLQPYTLS